MAQNTPEIIEVPALQSQQVKRKGSDADQHRKRLRTDDTMDIEVVPKENDEKYATKEDVNIIMERISKIESRVAKIERTFESLKSAFLGPNYPSRAISSSASCAPGPTLSASKSSNSSSTSAAMSAERTPSSAMISSKEASPSVVQPALSTRTAPAMSTLQTPLSSAAQSAQQAPLSSPAKSAQKTPLPAAARSVLGTPNSSASKSAQVTPISSASKSAQVTPISSASKSAQVTPISSALKSAQVTPISSGGKSVQVTPISSTGVSAQVTVTPISSAGKSAQVTSISSAPKPIQRTPPSGAKSVQGTSSSAPTSFYETTPLGKKSTQGISTSGAKSAQAPSIGVSKPVKAPSTTQSAQSTSSPAVAPPASNLRHRPAVNSVQGSLTSAVQRKNIEAIDDEVTVIPTDDSEIAPVSIGTNKPRINVIPQKELFAVPPDQPTSERNRQSHNQQRSGSRVVSNVASQTRSQQLASTSSSSTSIRAQTSSHEGAQTNMNESWSSSGAIDVSDMPEEVFSLIPPKQEIYDNPEGGKIESSTNKQLVAYIDGDCRKKKNHDIYAAVAGYSLNGTKIYSVPYVSDLKRPFTHNMPAVKANRKMVELVKQQTEVMAAYLFISGFKSLGASCNDTLKVVSRCQRLVQIMKGPRDVYPCINTCQCDRFPCNHSRRWETLDNFAHSLSDDLPRLVLATKRAGINVEWCNYSPFDQEEKKITESLKKDFKKKISELLSKTNPNTRPS